MNYHLSPVLPGDEARHGRRRGSWPRGANKGGREGNSEQQVASGRGLGKPMETHGVGSIPINTIFRGMNIHLPAMLMWTTGVQGFDTLPHGKQIPFKVTSLCPRFEVTIFHSWIGDTTWTRKVNILEEHRDTRRPMGFPLSHGENNRVGGVQASFTHQHRDAIHIKGCHSEDGWLATNRLDGIPVYHVWSYCSLLGELELERLCHPSCSRRRAHLPAQASWISWILRVKPHGSLNVPIFHITQPWSVYGLFYGYFFRWCPIFPKWDSYQPLNLLNLLGN